MSTDEHRALEGCQRALAIINFVPTLASAATAASSTAVDSVAPLQPDSQPPPPPASTSASVSVTGTSLADLSAVLRDAGQRCVEGHSVVITCSFSVPRS